jgi:hypothetical protein
MFTLSVISHHMFVVLLSLSGGFLLLAVFFAYQASAVQPIHRVQTLNSDPEPGFLLNPDPDSTPRFFYGRKYETYKEINPILYGKKGLKVFTSI